MAADAFTVINSQTLGSPQNNFTFTSIPQTYTDLQIVLTASRTVAGEAAYMRLGTSNTEDTGNNYNRVHQGMYGDTVTQGPAALKGFAVDQNYLFFAHANTNIVDSNWTSRMVINIHRYTDTTWQKTGSVIYNYSLNNTSGYTSLNETTFTSFLWANTSALNYIKLYTTADNFAVGSTATLYGIKAA